MLFARVIAVALKVMCWDDPFISWHCGVVSGHVMEAFFILGIAVVIATMLYGGSFFVMRWECPFLSWHCVGISAERRRPPNADD